MIAARVWLKEAHDVVERHRFTDAAAPEYADHLARHYVEADVLEDDPISKGLADVFELDVGSECVRSSHGYLGSHEMTRRSSSSEFFRNEAPGVPP